MNFCYTCFSPFSRSGIFIPFISSQRQIYFTARNESLYQLRVLFLHYDINIWIRSYSHNMYSKVNFVRNYNRRALTLLTHYSNQSSKIISTPQVHHQIHAFAIETFPYAIKIYDLEMHRILTHSFPILYFFLLLIQSSL